MVYFDDVPALLASKRKDTVVSREVRTGLVGNIDVGGLEGEIGE